MDIRKLIEEIDSIRQIAETWKETDNTPGIEKGIVLDKLKKIYEMVQLPYPAPGAAETECTIRAAASAVAPPDVPVPTAEPVAETAPEAAVAVPSEEPVVAPAIEIETKVSVEQQLFGDEQTVRPRMDKQVILSLYGDAPTQPVHTYNNPAPQARSCEAPQPAPAVAAEPAGLNGQVPDTAAHKKVLGETFTNGNGVAMNEMLGKQTAHADVASKLQSQSISGDLRQCIGINDRFMLIRSLFNGNADQYAAAIAQLNAFTDLNDALLYIQENYQWDPDSEGVRLIVDLLERKLG